MNEQKLWFRAKTFGWGWYPVTWQGWMATGIYILSILCGATRINDASSIRQIIVDFFIPLILSSTLFFMLAWKTGERPSWRWGAKRSNESEPKP